MVNYEVVAEKLERARKMFLYSLFPNCLEAQSHYFLYLIFQNFTSEVERHLCVSFQSVYQDLKMRETDCVSFFKWREILSLLLNSDISQMDRFTVQIREVELLRRGPAVAFLCYMHFQVVIQEDPDSDVELSTFNQERVSQILLNYKLRAFVLERSLSPSVFLFSLRIFSQTVQDSFLLYILNFLLEKRKWIKQFYS